VENRAGFDDQRARQRAKLHGVAYGAVAGAAVAAMTTGDGASRNQLASVEVYASAAVAWM
jgi:hypothetical protein